MPACSRFNNWILNLHLYGGLLSCCYLILFGISSLSFNHSWLVPQFKGTMEKREVALVVPDISDDLQLAETMRDRLGLIGWPLPWNMERDHSGNLHFELSRPGMSYQIYLNASAGLARIEAQRTGPAPILHFLHGSTEGIPGSKFMTAWGIYTEITTWFTLFALCSGIWLWIKHGKTGGELFFGLLGSSVVSIAMLLYLYFQG